MIRHWSHARQKGWGYPPKKTACQSDLRFQRYKPPKSVTTAGGPAGRPLILRFLVYISRNSLRASRSLVISIVTLSIHRRTCDRFGKGPMLAPKTNSEPHETWTFYCRIPSKLHFWAQQCSLLLSAQFNHVNFNTEGRSTIAWNSHEPKRT